MSQKLFVSNNHIISIIMNFFHRKFVLVCNLLLWEEVCQDSLVLSPMCLIFRSETRYNLPCGTNTGGLRLYCSPMKHLSCKKITPYPDYHPT